jgi:DNA-binding MarR family transcriptional regulator
MSNAPATRIPMPMLLFHARATYIAAMRTALIGAGYDDIPRKGVHVIGVLAHHDQPSPLARLIDELRLSKQAAGQLADALVNGGYIERNVDPGDRRKLNIALTDRGRAAARTLVDAHQSVDAKLLALAGPANLECTRQTLFLLGSIDQTSSRNSSQEAP